MFSYPQNPSAKPCMTEKLQLLMVLTKGWSYSLSRRQYANKESSLHKDVHVFFDLKICSSPSMGMDQKFSHVVPLSLMVGLLFLQKTF